MADRTVIEWDKDDLDALGMLKIDVLALGMLTCIRKAFDLIARHHGGTLDAGHRAGRGSGRLRHAVPGRFDRRVPGREPGADDACCRGCKPRTFYDLVIEVAIVRPGPDPGRHGAPLSAPPQRRGAGRLSLARSCAEVLGKTLGVPLFQEQAMKIAIVAAGFTPGEADRLRRAMATFRRVRHDRRASATKFIDGMVARGYDARLRRALLPARSRASATTASPRATPPASRCWSTSRPG